MIKRFWKKCRENKEIIKTNVIFSLQMTVLMLVMAALEYVLLAVVLKVIVSIW